MTINCNLPASTQIKNYGIGIVIEKDVSIKENVLINQHVKIIGKRGKSPVLEENVVIRAHAKIIGDVTVGHDSLVGAGAVVLDDVPPYSLAVGVPARIIKGKYKDKLRKGPPRMVNGKYVENTDQELENKTNSPAIFKNIFRFFKYLKYLIESSNSYKYIGPELPSTTKLRNSGKGVLISREVEIKENVIINENVTIGARKGKKNSIIGENVVIRSNAVIIGDVTVGHDSVIDKGAVVLDDVPPYSFATGVPARIKKRKYKQETNDDLEHHHKG